MSGKDFGKKEARKYTPNMLTWCQTVVKNKGNYSSY